MTMQTRLVTLVICIGFFVAFFGPLFAARAFGACHSRACWQRVHVKRAHHWCITHPYCVWKHRFKALPPEGKRWARCVSWKESRNQRIARASGFLSYFQWTASTWSATGGSGNPEYSATWYEQAVRAWFWHLGHPTGQWPNTGERGICGG